MLARLTRRRLLLTLAALAGGAWLPGPFVSEIA